MQRSPRRVQKLTRQLADAEIRHALELGVARVVWDSELKGFGLKVQPSGSARLVVRYLANGRVDSKSQRELRIGPYPALPLTTARAMASKTLVDVLMGADPVRERKDAREAATMDEAFPDWLASLNGKLKAATLAEYERQWLKVIQPALGSVPVRDVAEDDLQRLHAKMRQTPTMADRVRARLHTFFRWCERSGLRPRHSNPTEFVARNGDTEKERYLHKEEIVRLLEALDLAETTGLPTATHLKGKKSGASKQRPSRARHGARRYTLSKPRPSGSKRKAKEDGEASKVAPMNPVAIAALRFAVFSGFRESEVLSLRWDAVNFDDKVVLLADTKTGASRRDLSDTALEILRRQQAVVGNPFVFPGKKHGAHLKESRHVWYAVREAAKLDDVRLHDLRHTFASVMISAGASLPETGKALGHKDYKSTQRYAKLFGEPVRKAAQRAADDMLAWQRGTDTPVTPIRKQGA